MTNIYLFLAFALFSFSALADNHRYYDYQRKHYESRNYNKDHSRYKDQNWDKTHKRMWLRDGEIAYILSKVNKAEVEVADSIKHRLKNSEVKNFAKMMIKEHGEAEKKACKLLEQEGLLKSPNKWGLKIDKKKEMIIYHLRQHSASAKLDRAYMESQIEMHEMVLQTLDEKFIPSSKNNVLKASLYEKRDTVARHLAIAKDIASKLP